MDMKDINICAQCGKTYLSLLKHEKSLFLGDNIINTNFNDDLNDSYIDNLFKLTTRETLNTSNNIIIPTMYSVTNFNFFIEQKKSEQNSINNTKKKREKKYNKFKYTKKLGRKTKRDIKSILEQRNNEPETHDKFKDDNMRKKCKNIILKYLFEFINEKLKIVYKNNMGHGDNKKQLKILDQKGNNKSTLEIEKAFLDKKLLDIFSKKISERCCNYSPEHNKIIIDALINEKDIVKKDYFSKIFNLKFSDCLKYFIGEKYFIELQGMKDFSAIKEDLLKENGEKYVNHLQFYLKNYEELINKKSRKFDKNGISKIE